LIEKKLRGSPPISQSVDVTRTEYFVALQSLSGGPLARPDDGSAPEFLPTDCSVRELGAALLAALSRCRHVPSEEREFYSLAKRLESYDHCEKEILRRTGKRSKTRAYEKSIWCRVRRAEGQINIRPNRPAGRGTWKPLPVEEHVVILETTDPDALGAALKLAFERGQTFEG